MCVLRYSQYAKPATTVRTRTPRKSQRAFFFRPLSFGDRAPAAGGVDISDMDFAPFSFQRPIARSSEA
jgi:hypothetical protein